MRPHKDGHEIAQIDGSVSDPPKQELQVNQGMDVAAYAWQMTDCNWSRQTELKQSQPTHALSYCGVIVKMVLRTSHQTQVCGRALANVCNGMRYHMSK